MSADDARKVCFSSGQERKMFPRHFAPDRMGNHMSRPEAPHLGPGCYDNDEFGSMLYDLQKKPCSNRGYGISARTAARFPACKTVTPSPQKYQQDQSHSRVPPPGKTPFNSTTQRFERMPHTAEDNPGPGSYTPAAVTNRKVSWPMCFGSPAWSEVPQPERKSLRVKLKTEEEFLKNRSRVAYLSLYY